MHRAVPVDVEVDHQPVSPNFEVQSAIVVQDPVFMTWGVKLTPANESSKRFLQLTKKNTGKKLAAQFGTPAK